MDNVLKEKLLKAMEDREVRVPALSLATGIPQDRIYKWFSQNTNPKAEDTQKLNDWINGKQVLEQNPQYVTFSNEQYIESLQAQIKLMDANNILLRKMYEEKLEKLEISLNEIRSNQSVIFALLRETATQAAHYRYGSDKKKLDSELNEINKVVVSFHV